MAQTAPRPLTPAWMSTHATRPGASAVPLTTGAANAAAVRQSIANMADAARRITAASQSQARAALIVPPAVPPVPNGLTPGGLVPSGTSQPWLNATKPVQSVDTSKNKVTVTVTQTAPTAIAYWNSFNVGAATSLVFDQSAGGSAANTWVVLNRVLDPSVAPSTILGQIQAAGQVYIVNRNGILFGPGSQVNTSGLLASAADFAGGMSGGYAGFLTHGIYSVTGATGLLPSLGGDASSSPLPGASVTVMPGASIVTAPPPSVLNGGGLVLLAAPTVTNAGRIDTPKGQTILAGGQSVVLTPGYTTSGTGDPLATTLGTEAAVTQGGIASNSGLITAATGDITLVGETVTQAGILYATSTTGQRGTIHLLTPLTDTNGTVTLAQGGLTWIAPDTTDSSTALNSQRAQLIASSASDNALRLTTTPALNDIANLADQLDQSRIELTAGGSILAQGGSLTMAQGGQIAAAAGVKGGTSGLIHAASGAVLDVSGSPNVVLPASANFLPVTIQSNELRDSPANRLTQALSGSSVTVDARNLTTVAATTADPSIRYYTPGGLLEVSGELANVGHTIGEWSAVGGTIQLSAPMVAAQPGAIVNLAGGTVTYQAGTEPVTWLVDASGQLHNLATAPSSLTYTSVYDGFSVSSKTWGKTSVFASQLAAPTTEQVPAYTVGRDAGGLIISAPQVQFAATIDAGVAPAPVQTAARPSSVADPFLLGQTVAPLPGSLSIGGYAASGLNSALAATVVLGGGAPASIPSPGDPFPAATIYVAANTLNGAGLGGLSVTSADTLTVASPLTLSPGASVSLTAPDIAVEGTMTVPDGTVRLTNKFAAVTGGYLKDASGGASITMAPRTAIAATGIWSNGPQDPGSVSYAAFRNGGSVTLDSSGGVTVGTGASIDVSAGGALSLTGAFTGGAGGSISLVSNDGATSTSGLAPLVLGGRLTGYGVTGGGTLTLTAPAVTIATVGTGSGLLLTPDVFRSGFGTYAVTGLSGVSVAPNTTLDIVAPREIVTAATAGTPAWSGPGAAFDLALPPLFTPDPTKATVTQRPGASLSLSAAFATTGGPLTVGDGASLKVDPGQSVSLTAYNSLVVDGSITAPGGKISIVNTRYQDGTDTQRRALFTPGLDIWIGPNSRLDVAGIAYRSLDQSGQPFGIVENGGTISLGGIGGTSNDGTTRTTDAQIVVASGAVLDASGAHAVINPFAGGTGDAAAAGLTPAPLGSPVLVGGSGGTISESSYTGIFDDGRLLAHGGAAGAAGGTLSMTMETPVYDTTLSLPAASLLYPAEIVVGKVAAPLVPSTLAQGQAIPQSQFAKAYLDPAWVTDGGFGSVSLSSRGLILFDGTTTLKASQSITLSNGIFAQSGNDAKVRVVAPYVKLDGLSSVSLLSSSVTPNITNSWTPASTLAQGSFTVAADLIDLRNDIRFGTSASVTVPGNAPHLVSAGGFTGLTLKSTGDIRFLGASGSASNKTTLLTSGDATLVAAQLYPVSFARASVVAGYDFQVPVAANPLLQAGRLAIVGDGTDPAAPLSVGGSLSLIAGTVIQDGIVRAPLGTIDLGAVGSATTVAGFGKNPTAFTTTVVAGKNSITSVSANGEVIPYGGTNDTVTYTYDGSTAAGFSPSIALLGQAFDVRNGAMLDLSGGGTLTGGGGEVLSTNSSGQQSLVSQGFIAGRGGSTDVLTTPLMQFNPTAGSVSAPSLTKDPVYAIVAGPQPAEAPVTPLDTSSSYYGSVPSVGAQITIGPGVSGLPAGTYTLLPSYYALLPGGYRVQLATGTPMTATTPVQAGYGTSLLPGYLGVSGTRIAATAPVPVYVTPGSAVRAYSQYDEQSYSAFQLAQAAQFGTPRPLLPADAGTLDLSYATKRGLGRALTFNGKALLSPGVVTDATPTTPAVDGYGGTLSVTGTLNTLFDITGNEYGSPASIPLSAAALDAIMAPRMVIGGSIAYNPGAPGTATEPSVLLSAAAGRIVMQSGAVLSAPEVFLLASSATSKGSITIETGATIDTIGAGTPPYDSTSTGLAYDVQRNTALMVSNGTINLAPINTSDRAVSGPLSIANGASLLSSGSIIATTESTVSIGTGVTFGTRALDLFVPVVNFGTPPDKKVPVPQGLTLSQSVLSTLLAGNPADGAPGLSSLTLTASEGVNFYGSVDLTALGGGGTGLNTLVLNTPAIYGQGTASDAASLSTGTLIWNGVAGTSTAVGPVSATPEGIVTNGPGSGLGTLSLNAGTIVLGYAPGSVVESTLTLDRTIAGFSAVTLSASNAITFNNDGTLRMAGNGNLDLITPLVAGTAGAATPALTITTPGAVTLSSAGGSPSANVTPAQGATLSITGASVSAGTTIAAPAGSIGLTATKGDVTLTGSARLLAAGRGVELFDQTTNSPGGSVRLESGTGDIVARSGSVIDVSSPGAAGGTVSATALAGTVTLDGTLLGGGGSGRSGGGFALRTNLLGGGTSVSAAFASLNASLDSGGFTASRDFDIGTGDLTVSGTIRAADVTIAASGGSLTINGTIDASGAAPGSITLSAMNGLTLADGSLIDAHGSVLQVDSTGVAIPASNRADVSLTARTGMLTLDQGARIDVSNPGDTAYGTVELYAPRTSDGGVAISAASGLTINGASSIALYGMRTYTPADGTVTQVYLNGIDGDNTAFITGALQDAAFLNGIPGLLSQGGTFHLRPGVEIDSATPEGTLTVSGDLDLHLMRYESLSGAASVEPGALALRAGGTLNVFGGISDGFGAAPDNPANPNPDDNGWKLLSGVEPVGQTIVVPRSVTLATGTAFPTDTGQSLNYAITVSHAAIAAGVPIPAPVTLAGSYRVPTGGMVATANIYGPNHVLEYAKGTLIPAKAKIKSGWTMDAGAVMPFEVHLAPGTVVPAGTPLSDFVGTSIKLAADAVVPAGGLIPGGTNVRLPNGATSVALRPSIPIGGVQGSAAQITTAGQVTTPTDGSIIVTTAAKTLAKKPPPPPPPATSIQGTILATAPLLPAGSLSWSMSLVGGANLASSNTRAVRASTEIASGGNAGDIVLSDPHYVNPPTASSKTIAPEPGLSVIRTGTGDLSLTAGGSINEDSVFGIYTAGAQSPGVTQAFEQPRGTQSGVTTVLATATTNGYDYNALLSGYQAWYPTGGGNVDVVAQGAILGDVVSVSRNGAPIYQSDAVGNWLWRQGGFAGQPAAWWINFGSYADSSSGILTLVGFSGIGTLGGGDVTVKAGAASGNTIVDPSSLGHTTALDVVVASTGQVTSVTTAGGAVTGGTIQETGGGTLDVSIAGALNPANTSTLHNGIASQVFGVIGSMRGPVSISATSIGAVVPSAVNQAAGSQVVALSDAYGGPLLVLGDSAASITTAGDLVLGGVIDPGRVTTANTSPFSITLADGTTVNSTGGGRSDFTLWQPTTSIALFSAGGNLVPTLDVAGTMVQSDMNLSYPPSLSAMAPGGSILFGANTASSNQVAGSLELAPSPVGTLTLLAGVNIDAAGLSTNQALGIDISGARSGPNDISNPFRPATQGSLSAAGGSTSTVSNATNAFNFGGVSSLFTFEADTAAAPGAAALHAADTTQAHLYAGANIIDLNFGETWHFFSGTTTLATWYLAAEPAQIQAGQDILGGGTTSLLPVQAAIDSSGLKATRNLILNVSANDVSTVTAGRNIFYANYEIAGPGTLAVTAGKSLYQGAQGSFWSIGAIAGPSGQTNGASVDLLAGTGGGTPDWTNFANLYLNPANWADPTQPLGSATNLGKVIGDPANQALATAWLAAHYPGASLTNGLPASLTPAEQRTFEYQVLYPLLFSELAASATEYANPGSLRYHDYLRGGEAIAAMFGTSAVAPTPDVQAGFSGPQAAAWQAELGILTHLAAPVSPGGGGDIVMFGGSGVTTQLGGDIFALAPYGQLILGLSSVAPPTPVAGQPAAGLITAGQGDIGVLTNGNVALGQSRIFTTFGGGITVWSASGDIQTGVGSNTTQVFQPPQINYDIHGDLTLSPSAPTTGAGIATLPSIPGVPPGDIAAAVPFGVIDLGETGFRATGNVTIAGRVVGTGTISAGGKVSGVPTASAPNVGALASAAAAAGASSSQADTDRERRQRQNNGPPSLINVEVVSFGGGGDACNQPGMPACP